MHLWSAFGESIPGITWNGEDDKFIECNVAPGSGTFSATAQ